MQWKPTRSWDDGTRWELILDNGVTEGRVFRCQPNCPVEVCRFGAGYCSNQFDSMREAAEWLVEKVTSGTGAQ
jgi:hypothetical protein